MPRVQVDSLAEETIDESIVDAVCDVFRGSSEVDYVWWEDVDCNVREKLGGQASKRSHAVGLGASCVCGSESARE